MSADSEIRGVAAGVEPLDQRRVSVVCRSTRVDLSLPAHLELVAVIPEVVDLVRDHIRAAAGPASGVDVDARMGGGTGGSWQLSRLAGGPLAVSETLAQQRVHDGEILVLDHRPVPTPAPLFDDVLQGLTEPDVARSASWDRRDAVTTATAATAVVAVAAAVAATRQWWLDGGLTTPLVSFLLGLLGLAAVLALRRASVHGSADAVAGACAVGFTVLAGATVGGPPVGAGHLLGGLTAGSVLAALLRSTVFRPGPALGYDTAAGYLAACVALATGAVGALVAATTPTPAPAVGAGAVLVGLLVLTAAPRIAVWAARIPIPPVPAPGEDVEAGDLEDIDHDVRGRARGPLPTPGVLRHRFLTSRSWLTGLLAAAGAVCTAGSLTSLTGDGDTTRWSAPLALVLIVVLVLRGLGYADRVHTAVLLISALVLTASVLVGAGLTVDSPVGVVVPAAVAVAAAVIVAASVLPHVDLSPGALRAVGVVEAVALCAIVPLAVGAMEVYSLVRQR
ncbi:type VII secretion integral membrane protein EccD [Dietzia cinnamea]|uniref:Type VII secretion integral membrane protein EccD n=9 Tax=Dietziaceae TaxID=85029 RepID=A0ABV3YDG8_9ACTN|nr:MULTISPECIES: type VII secretion integral membrane protein EccD [Dietzia]AVM63271.1 type VII secretion integral membrane protein EccD [Dietzia sp. oral taxon 368]MCT2264807.1 type VII secretion integral membrane protein EccD [Dietzia cinnamea]